MEKFEIRLTSLEHFKNDMQAEMVERLTEQVSNRMNMSLGQYLPKVGELILNVDILTKKFERKVTVDNELN